MSKMDSQLYNYIMDHLSDISEEWLKHRNERNDSIYSIHAADSVKVLIREQNKLTNLTVASILLNDEKVFSENIEEWANKLAKSRVSSDTPIYEVINALSYARKAYWKFVELFVESNNEKVTVNDLLKWGTIIHSAFDQLTIKFSETYYLMMKNRISAQQSLINELGSPVILITSSIGILPLIGEIDTMRAKSVMDLIPLKCMEADITQLYIDLSGVSIVDTTVVHQVLELTKVLQLLGVKSIITGIRPEIAQTANQLGINFSDVETYSSLQFAIKKDFIN